MVRTQAKTWIHCPAQVVYDFVVVDFIRNYPRWSPEVRSLQAKSTGPLQVGWRACQIRVDQGRTTQTDFEVIHLEPGRRVAFQGVKDPYRIDFLIQPEGNHTAVIFTFELIKINMMIRPFEKLIRIAIQDGVDRTVRNLKTLIENEQSRNQ